MADVHTKLLIFNIPLVFDKTDKTLRLRQTQFLSVLAKDCLTWVGNHQDGAVRAVFDDLRNDEFEDVHVPLNQVETTLSLLLTNSCSYHHNLGVGCDSVVYNTARERRMH